MKAIELSVLAFPPHDGIGWTVRCKITNLPGNRIGFAEADTVAEAFNNSVLVALATGQDQEENHIS